VVAAAKGAANVMCSIGRGRLRNRLESGWIQHHKTTWAVAGGCGRQTGILKGKVQHPPLAGGHDPKSKGLSGGVNPGDCSLSRKQKIVIARGLEAIGIEGDAIMLFGFEPQDLSGNVLDGVEQLPIAGRQERGIRTTQFDIELRRLILRGGDLIVKIKTSGSEEAQEVFDGLSGQGGGVHGIAFIGDE
jgi:hypothetical protein